MTEAILRYPGAKWRDADWVVRHFPPHARYVEPFCGSAGVFFNKSPARHEVLNDIESDLVSFFRVLRDEPSEFMRRLELTPWSREEYQASSEAPGPSDRVDRALRFYVRAWQGHGNKGLLCGGSGWRHAGVASVDNRSTSIIWKQLPSRIAAVVDRLRDAEIENIPALDIIRRYDTPETLLYIDPPYPMSTRNNRKLYRHEMTDADHIELLDALCAHQGMVVISSYESALYTARLRGWQCVRMETLAEKAAVRTEVLWLNEAAASQQQMQFDWEEAA